EHAPAQEHGDADPGIGDDVRRDPERVAADADVPLDVPLHAPAGDELRGDDAPERAAGEEQREIAGGGVAPRGSQLSRARYHVRHSVWQPTHVSCGRGAPSDPDSHASARVAQGEPGTSITMRRGWSRGADVRPRRSSPEAMPASSVTTRAAMMSMARTAIVLSPSP